MTEHASAWKNLIDEWVDRERDLYPDAQIQPDSVEVRDAVEVGDHMFVLVSFDVAYPWPQEEDTHTQGRSLNTAVLQAARVRQPWIERDATRASAHLSSADRTISVSEHALGNRRAWSGFVEHDWNRVSLHFDDGSTSYASVVGGWFLSIESDERRLVSVAGPENESDVVELVRDDVTDMVANLSFTRTGSTSMYFSPLDLRAVHPLVRWQRSGNIVVVASCLEQYDDGGILRLRIDGIRADDDLFVSWPQVSLDINGQPVSSAACAEFAHKDTVTLDIGFRPWIASEGSDMTIQVRGLRGPSGAIEPITLELAERDFRA